MRMLLRGNQNDYVLYFIEAVFFLLLTHGAVGYVGSRKLLIAGFSIMLCMLLYLFKENNFKINKYSLYLMFVIGLIGCVPVGVAIIRFSSYGGGLFLIANILAFLFFDQSLSLKKHNSVNINMVLRPLVLAAIISSILAYFIHFLGPFSFDGLEFGRAGYYRLLGIFSTSNRFGEAPAIGSIIMLHTILCERKFKVWNLILFIFLFITAVASGSKGVILSSLLSFCLIIAFSRGLKKISLWIMFFFGIAVLVGLNEISSGFLLSSTKLDRYLDGAQRIDAGRIEIWAIGLKYYLNSEIFYQVWGHGPNSYFSLVGIDPHSSYITLLFEYGMPALFFVAIIFFSTTAHLVFIRHGEAFAIGYVLLSFCLFRGLTMPTIFRFFNFSMIAFWSGLALMLSDFKANRNRYRLLNPKFSSR